MRPIREKNRAAFYALDILEAERQHDERFLRRINELIDEGYRNRSLMVRRGHTKKRLRWLREAQAILRGAIG